MTHIHMGPIFDMKCFSSEMACISSQLTSKIKIIIYNMPLTGSLKQSSYVIITVTKC
jgi:hypothetical protein